MRLCQVFHKMNPFNFVIAKTIESTSARIGILESNDNSMKTPGFFVHTLAGSVPHLTKEVCDKAFPASLPFLQISIDTTFPFHENVKPSGMTISDFVGHKNLPSLLTVHNPLRELIPGFNDKFGVSIWTRKGRQSLSTSKFIDIVNSFRPNFFQILSDYDVTSSSSVKRTRKSVERSLTYLDEVLKNTNGGGFATIESAWFHVAPKEAEMTLAKIREKQEALNGFVINGVVTKCDDTLKIDEEVLSTVLSHLPQTKPRFVSGNLELVKILELIIGGIDLFDSSVVTQATEDGHAFCLELDSFLPRSSVKTGSSSDSASLVNESLASHGLGENEPATSSADELAIPKELLESKTILLNIKDKKYFDDFSPISSNCACYTCRRFTRAYVHHLLATSELLGPVLLMMHNLHQFDLFFQAIRLCLSDETEFKRLHDYLK